MEALVFGLLKKDQNSYIEWDDVFHLAQCTFFFNFINFFSTKCVIRCG